MKKFEYIVICANASGCVEEALNRYAKQGYRVTYSTGNYIIMEREI